MSYILALQPTSFHFTLNAWVILSFVIRCFHLFLIELDLNYAVNQWLIRVFQPQINTDFTDLIHNLYVRGDGFSDSCG